MYVWYVWYKDGSWVDESVTSDVQHVSAAGFIEERQFSGDVLLHLHTVGQEHNHIHLVIG